MKKTILVDETNTHNELQLYLNDQGRLYLEVGEQEGDNPFFGFITLNLEDANALHQMVGDVIKQMEEEGI